MSGRLLTSLRHFILVCFLVTLFLATDLHPDPLEGGKLRDAKTLASLMLAKRWLF